MKLLKITTEGMELNYLPGDKYVGQRIALGKYEPYETKLMLGQVKTGDTVIDIGANIGYYTLLLAQKVGPTGKVYAFEPEEINFEILKKNVEVNKLINVSLFNVGVGEKSEERELILSEENLGDHRIRSQTSDIGPQNDKILRHPSGATSFHKEAHKTEKIKVMRLEEVVKEKVDLIKIDTQGYEPFVIEGAKKIIEKYKPEIFLEYMPEALEKSGGDGIKMVEYLKKYYRNINIIDDYLFAYYQGKLPPDKYCKNKKGYADLWLTNKKSNWVDQYQDLRIKKLIRNIFGLPQTG